MDEIKDSSISAPAPMESASQAAPVTPSNQNGVSAPEPVSTPSQPAENKGSSAVPEGYVWNGTNTNELPEPLREWGKGVQRYATRMSQDAAKYRKVAKEYDEFRTSDDYKMFNEWKTSQSQAAPSYSQPVVSQEELEAAAGDPGKFYSLVDKMVESKVSSIVKQYEPVINDLQKKQAVVEAEGQIQGFAELHPDFWDLYDSGILKPILSEVVDKGGGTLEDAYAKAKEIESYYKSNAAKTIQKRVEEKKQAVSAVPSSSMQANTIFVDDPDEAMKVAFRNALDNKKVNVVVKRK